jgi:hypothetical protein
MLIAPLPDAQQGSDQAIRGKHTILAIGLQNFLE